MATVAASKPMAIRPWPDIRRRTLQTTTNRAAQAGTGRQVTQATSATRTPSRRIAHQIFRTNVTEAAATRDQAAPSAPKRGVDQSSAGTRMTSVGTRSHVNASGRLSARNAALVLAKQTR